MTRKNAGPFETEFMRLVEERVALGMDRVRAVKAVAKERPELHRKMLLEANEK
jgi:hypothetical protein